MRIVIIGGSGHIGTYLVPMLVESGHEVINVARGQRDPYLPHAAWRQVQQIAADRAAEDAAGTFGARIRDLNPEVVIDLICFTEDSSRQIVEALRGRISHFLHCGTIWAHGHSTRTPATEDQARQPFGNYGIQKWQIESTLLSEARRGGFPATVLMPGHIVGPGYAPLNPAGHFTPAVFTQMARGEALCLPNLGQETVHHVHAADVAQAFYRAMTHWSSSIGENFHTVSPAALSLRGYAEAMYDWFGKPPALTYLPWEDWRKTVTEQEAAATWDHIAHSPCASIEKARRLIGYAPRYSSLEAVQEAVSWLIDHNIVQN
ncbi:MAG: NAD(P)-dependent oxidoreductase [Anaerolineae bacterium]|nr:NAD(P)-dependent oxidoreductase [Anaerolineae bacterium]NUQ04498.1 NAD(P)-dependent oxidoreductase [Anaerolineae bacterium]